MKITDIRINLLKPGTGKVRAFASVTFDDEFAVHDFRVIESVKGLFVAMPSRKGTDGTYRETAHPITTPFRDLLHAAILRAYQDQAAQPHESLGSNA